MNTHRLSALLMASCLTLTAGLALADRTLTGDANVDQRNYPSTSPFVHPPFYNLKVTVEVDDNGIITTVRDNGTGKGDSVQDGNEELWEKKNRPYFDVAVKGGLLDRFVGKTADEVRAMDMRTGADAVSGATLVSGAAQEAVLNALNGRAGKTFLNVEGSAMPVASIEGNVVTLTSKLPKDFDLELLDIRWGVRNEEVVPVDAYTATVEDDKLILTFNDMTGMKAGYYYVNVVDASGKYRSPSFEGGPGAAQAPSFILSSGLTEKDLSFDGKGIVLAGGSLSDYLQNIEHVLIQAEGEEKITEQEIVGHHGTLSTFIALDENGILNADGVVKARNGDESPLFEAGKKYTVTVSAFGYPDLVFSYAKEDEAGTAAALLEAVKGTYTALFPVITDAQYDEIWLAPCVEALGSEMGPAAAEMLKGACNGTLYGPEAVEAYGDGSQGAAFDCLFIHGVSTITFDGTVISGKDEKGETVFSHEYAYAGKLSLGGMMDGLLYETADGDAGEFRYFFMMPDTPATTYHLEFRYGSNIEDLAKYNEGPYAYWLAAGFPVEADEKMIRKVITLFCEENLAGMQ